jgi:transcriptional regulator with XRE-family HTH domain
VCKIDDAPTMKIFEVQKHKLYETRKFKLTRAQVARICDVLGALLSSVHSKNRLSPVDSLLLIYAAIGIKYEQLIPFGVSVSGKKKWLEYYSRKCSDAPNIFDHDYQTDDEEEELFDPETAGADESDDEFSEYV